MVEHWAGVLRRSLWRGGVGMWALAHSFCSFVCSASYLSPADLKYPITVSPHPGASAGSQHDQILSHLTTSINVDARNSHNLQVAPLQLLNYLKNKIPLSAMVHCD